MVPHAYNPHIQQAETGLINLREQPEVYVIQINMSLHSRALSQKTPDHTSTLWSIQVKI